MRAVYDEKGASGNAFLRKEKFRAPVSRQVKTLKVLKKNSQVSRPEITASIINCFQRPHYPSIRSIITWNINGLCAPRYGQRLKWSR